MTKELRTVYLSDDGEVFDSEKDCLTQEATSAFEESIGGAYFFCEDAGFNMIQDATEMLVWIIDNPELLKKLQYLSTL